MRNSTAAFGLLTATLALPTQAEYLYGFGNVYLDYLTWTHGTQGYNDVDVSDGRDDHVTVGAEGGAGFSWGELYGFYEYEKLGKGSHERSQAGKFSLHYKVFDNISLYGQIYDYSENGAGNDFSEQNRVLGVGFLGLTGSNYWFKPWIGLHDVTTGNDLASGLNGGMVGWSAGASFNLFNQPFMVTNWNEIEFARNDAYKLMQNGSTGLNGGASLWYDITKRVYVGVTYRYFANKLGVKGYGDAWIFRVGVHL